MSEYIDREALMRKLSRILGVCYNEEKESAMSVVLRTEYAVMDSPIVDVAPVMHGQWEPIINAYGGIEGCICKRCGIATKQKSNYCPNCGAKMDLEG